MNFLKSGSGATDRQAGRQAEAPSERSNPPVVRVHRAARPSLPLYGLHGSGGGGGRVIDSNGGRRGGELRVSDFEVGEREVVIPT